MELQLIILAFGLLVAGFLLGRHTSGSCRRSDYDSLATSSCSCPVNCMTTVKSGRGTKEVSGVICPSPCPPPCTEKNCCPNGTLLPSGICQGGTSDGHTPCGSKGCGGSSSECGACKPHLCCNGPRGSDPGPGYCINCQ